MPTLRLIYDVPDWAYHRNAQGLERYAPPDFEVSSAPIRVRGQEVGWDAMLGDKPADLLFLFDFSRTARLRAELTRRGWTDTRLMVAWSVGWPLSQSVFYQTCCRADAMLVSNHEYWTRMGRLPASYAIPYGVDGAIFNVRTPIETRRPKVLWVGSDFARQLKGYDDLILPLQAALQARGIDCEALLVDSFGAVKRSAEEMAAWYNSGTVLVCASTAEGTPNPPLEAAACGCTIVSTRVGNMPELIRQDVNGYLVDRDPDALLTGVLAAVENHERLAKRMQQDIAHWLWAHRSQEYYAVFREVLDSGPRPAATRRAPHDLSQKVTVYVTTVGGPTFRECLDLLCRQDSKFGLQIIENVTPLTAALQRMLDTCRTPYYIQVDEDMLLYPHAVRTLVERLDEQGPDVVTYVGDLYDAHLERGIQGIKISRHDLARRYPWSETPFVLDRNDRIAAGGYRITASPTEGLTPTSPSVLGLHGTAWTPESIFGRYYMLESWRRARPETMSWFADFHGVLLQRFLRAPNELNFLALTGVIAAAPAAAHMPIEKDAARDGSLPGFAALRKLFADLVGGNSGEHNAGRNEPVPPDGPRKSSLNHGGHDR